MRKAGPNRKSVLYFLGLSITTASSSCKFAQNKHFLTTQVIWKNFVGLFLSYFIWLYLIPRVPSKCNIPNLAQLISSYTSTLLWLWNYSFSAWMSCSVPPDLTQVDHRRVALIPLKYMHVLLVIIPKGEVTKISIIHSTKARLAWGRHLAAISGPINSM